MVNEEIVILNNIKTILKNTGSFNFVGEFRDQQDFSVASGQNYPCLLLEDFDEVLSPDQQNLNVEKEFTVNIYLYHNVKKAVTKTMTDLVTVIEDTLLDDSFLDTLIAAITGTMTLIQWNTTEKGVFQENFDYRTPGFSNDKICWKLNFSFNFRTAR